MKIKGIVFDLDDTLYDQIKPFAKAAEKLFPNSSDMPMADIFATSRKISDLLWRYYKLRRITLEELREQRVIGAFREFGIIIDSGEAREFQRIYQIEQDSIKLDEKAESVLRFLAAKEYRLGLITNGPSDHQWSKIAKLELTQYIPKDFIFISDEVGSAKPESLIFREAENRMKLEGNSMVYIGDSWENDVVAPMMAGWKSIWFNRRKRLQGKGDFPIAVIDDLAQIPSIIG